MGVHPADRRALPKLILGLQDPDGSVRLHSAALLGLMGEKAMIAIPALSAALRDQDPAVRRMVASALKVIDPSAAKRSRAA